MKKITLLLVFLLSTHISFGQGNSVLTAEPFCAGSSPLLFPNVTGQPNLSTVGCLYTTPNPAYYYLTIDQPGNLVFTITQVDMDGFGIDVDFIAWGPFTSIADADANITHAACTPTACPNNTVNPGFYPYATDHIVDCSYDSSPNETLTINGALAGQIYVVLITNFDGDPGFISFHQTGGTGTTSCNGIPVCGGDFYDSGGNTGSYSNNENRTVTIYPDTIGGWATVNFTMVDIAAGDVLTIYNGPNATYPSLGTVTGPSSFASTDPSGALTFVFTSNASGVGDGWEANVVCHPPAVCGGNFYDSGGNSGNYTNNENRTVTLYPDIAGGWVSVNFTMVNIAAGDILTAYDGPNNSYTSLGAVTGPSSYTSTDPSGALTFVFTSNASGVSAGWAADVVCHQPPPPSNDLCADAIDLPCGTTNMAGTTNFTTNIPNNTGCSMSDYGVWYTFVGDGDQTTITTTAAAGFDHEMAIASGSCGSLTNIVCRDSGLSGGTESYTFITTLGVTYYVYIAHWNNSSNATGNFTISRTCYTYTPPACGGNFYDSGGPTGNYGNNENTTTTIYPDTPGDAVTVTFTAFQLEGCCDYLRVYDGPNNTYPLLGSYNGTTIPGPFTSSDPSGALTFVFTSDSSVNYPGWAANITCGPYVPPVVCGSTFYDSGGPSGNYGSYENTTTTFYPDTPGDIVTVTFTAFNTENGWDGLMIYDGPDATAPLISSGSTFNRPTCPNGAWTGTGAFTAQGQTFTSTHPSGALTFVFTSDGSLQYAGWAANITCTSPCDDYIVTVTNGDICGEGEVALSATATPGTTQYYWYTTPTGGTPIPPYTANWTTPTINTTTTYYVAAYNGTCESDRVPVMASILPTPTAVTINTVLEPLGADPCDLDYAELTASGGNVPALPSTIYSENFNAATLPAGWTISNQSGTTTQWIIYNSNIAGGTAYELNLESGGLYDDGTWIAKTPAINISGYSTLELNLKHYLYHYQSIGYPYSTFIEISNDDSSWITIWSRNNVTTSEGPQTLNFDLNSYIGTNLYIRFRIIGRTFGIFRWNIDDIEVTGTGIASSQITWSPTAGLYLDAGLTTPYTNEDVATVYAAPNDSETYTATATGSNGCTSFDTVTVTRGNKVWNGSVNNNWYNPNNWTPAGVPTPVSCVVIPDVVSSNNRSPIADYSLIGPPVPPSTPALARNVTINNNGTLTVNANSYLEIVEWLNVATGGEVLIRDSGSLIQLGNPASNNNTGSIRVQRTATGVGNQNYVYWSSPVEGFNVEDINTAASELRWEWNPTIDGIHNGIWVAASGTMTPGKGYIVRGLATPPAPIPPETAEFVGRPSNGIIPVPITRGTYTGAPYTAVGGGDTQATNIDDNWNLVGNPYPSAVSANAFIAANAAQLADNGAIVGTIYLWQRGNLPTGGSTDDPFYGDYDYNYLDDYLAYNSTGSNPPGFSGNIAAGQSFFIQMDDGVGTSSTVTFNNTMRDRTLANNDFLRSGERHRIWLDLINDADTAVSTLVGYTEGATNEIDILYDGHHLSGSNLKLYSLLEEEAMTIQGRALPFDNNDIVPLGISVPENGTYKIAINQVDGLFIDPSQPIYLEDKYVGLIYNLRSAPYLFTTGGGEFNDRFILRYTDQTLSIPEEAADYGFNIIGVQDYIKVTTSGSPINSVTIYDVLGRVLADYKQINSQEFKIELTNISNGTLIVKATLDNGHRKFKKIVYSQ